MDLPDHNFTFLLPKDLIFDPSIVLHPCTTLQKKETDKDDEITCIS